LGNNFPQKSSFTCKTCEQKIVIGIKKQNEDIFFEGCTYRPDRTPDDINDSCIIIQNLHPELPIDSKYEHDPFYFASTQELIKLVPSGTSYQPQTEVVPWDGFREKWPIIEQELRVLSKRGEDALKSINGTSAIEFSMKLVDWIEIYISGIWHDQHLPIIELVKTHLKSEHLVDVSKYFKNDEQKWLTAIFDFISTYMRFSGEFEGPILFQKFAVSLDDSHKVCADWDEIRSVYGDLYEIYGDLLVFPTILNNLESGRKFNEFIDAKFTLEKYLEIDKATRIKNLLLNNKFEIICSSYLPWLRNGTHHRKCKFYPFTNTIELGSGKGGLSVKRLSLTDYVKFTNNLFASGLIIAQLIVIMIYQRKTT